MKDKNLVKSNNLILDSRTLILASDMSFFAQTPRFGSCNVYGKQKQSGPVMALTGGGSFSLVLGQRAH